MRGMVRGQELLRVYNGWYMSEVTHLFMCSTGESEPLDFVHLPRSPPYGRSLVVPKFVY